MIGRNTSSALAPVLLEPRSRFGGKLLGIGVDLSPKPECSSQRAHNEKCLLVCHPLPLFMAVSMIPNIDMAFELLLHAVFVAGEIWGDFA